VFIVFMVCSRFDAIPNKTAIPPIVRHELWAVVRS
jgi:hypothetical protein